jgi:NADH dehydrogenase (ubiquinone) 1 beta subcomplex subunit 8
LSEQDEILSVFAIDVHDQVTVPFALKWFFGFAGVFAGVSYLVYLSAPDKIAEPRKYPYAGLEKELGGPMNPVQYRLCPC